jgi:hypothetical protein
VSIRDRSSVFMPCALGLALSACSAAMPDPAAALSAYADAAAKGDAKAIHSMLTDEAKRQLSPEEVARLVADERAELSEQAQALRGSGNAVRARARLRYADGEVTTLELERGEFRVAAADALPVGARTPVEALAALRRVLARRSYAGLMRVLSPATRAAIESDLRQLVEGLERPEGLEVHVAGDAATVQIPGGHEVRLRREAGLWRVDDFD